MTSALLIVALVATSVSVSHGNHTRETRRLGGRVGSPEHFAWFEFAPTSGKNMGGVCECSATLPKDASGTRSLELTRSTQKYCTAGVNGLRTTGIATGDLSLCVAGRAAVMLNSNGVKALSVEEAGVNRILQTQAFDDAAWSDVGTPTVTANAGQSPRNNTTADSIEDDDGAGFEGRSQNWATVATGAHTVSIYVRSVSGATKATLRLLTDGTGSTDCTATDLSTETWHRMVCSATVGGSPTYVGMSIEVGTAASDTGVLLVWGAMVENAKFATSVIISTASSGTRSADYPRFTLTEFTMTAPWSVAGTTQMPTSISGCPTNSRPHGALGPVGFARYHFDSYFASGTTFFLSSSQSSVNPSNTGYTCTNGGINRAVSWHSGSAFGGCLNGNCNAGAAATWTDNTVSEFRLGQYSSSNGVVNGLVSNICLDPSSATRCR